MANVILESARGYDSFRIEDEMMKNNREIFLVQDVNPASANELIKQLMYLDREDDTAEITLYINSPGGSVQDGLTIYDVITLLHAPVRTVCLGCCASMGAILFLAGEKREMMKHGKIMIHDPSYSHHDIGGRKPHEIQAELDDLNQCREELAKIIAERTGQPLETVYEVTAKDTYFNADEAMAFGIATNIVS